MNRVGFAPARNGDASLDASALAMRLKNDVEGEVRFDSGSRALYATDASNYRQVPIGVVVPLHVADVMATLSACRESGAPVLARGGGTSLAGQCCNVAVVMDFSKYLNRVLEINAPERWARVEPGVVLDQLRGEAAKHGLTFGPDPATHSHCTLGGMLGNDSCGVHSVMAQLYGTGPRTADNTLELDVVTYDGTRLTLGATSEDELRRLAARRDRVGQIHAQLLELRDRYAHEIRTGFPRIPRRVSGYNLDELLPERGCQIARALVGSESTCAITLEARLMLIPAPAARVLAVLAYEDICTAGDHVMEILAGHPVALEALDDRLIGYMKRRGLHVDDLGMLPKGGGWLLVEFGGDSREDAEAQARRLMQQFAGTKGAPLARLFTEKSAMKKIWDIREAGLGATAFVPGLPDSWPGWEDSAVPPERIGDYMRALRELFDEYGFEVSLYGHIGQGCVHCRIPFDLVTHRGIGNYLSFTRKAADLVHSFGGSLSGEHGDGQARADLLPRMYGEKLVRAFADFKSIWDPLWRLNPGKVVRPNRRDQHLRIGTEYEPAQPRTHFSFMDDGGFARASLRCVGVGECRRDGGGVMCPSYMATREEKHSTRGRARMLFEMLRGEVLHDGWKNDAVLESLDLCLACKGCKSDCPMGVDMASYKAEFMSHHYEHRLRPRHMYFFGRIHGWANLASMAPRLWNALLARGPVGGLARHLAQIEPARALPVFAARTFRQEFRRPQASSDRPRVLLWPDTFNDHFHPQVAHAAVEVLDHAGFTVDIPRRRLCCGRPLYDCGWLDAARARLSRVLDVLRSEIRAGTPLVMLEPSCAAVFRDEMMNLFPHDPDAVRLRDQTFLLCEFLHQRAPDFAPRGLQGRRALLQVHCHQHALMKSADEQGLLHKLGIDAQRPEQGCCGMAGPFGFRRGEAYQISVRCAERHLMPAVRAAGAADLVIADGYSCREQIAQLGGRQAMHLAEVLAAACRAPR